MPRIRISRLVHSSGRQINVAKQKDSAMQYMFWFLQNKEMHVASSAYEFSHYKIYEYYLSNSHTPSVWSPRLLENVRYNTNVFKIFLNLRLCAKKPLSKPYHHQRLLLMNAFLNILTMEMRYGCFNKNVWWH